MTVKSSTADSLREQRSFLDPARDDPLDLLTWTERHLCIGYDQRGEPLPMRVPAPIRRLYEDAAEKVVVMKGAQLGISEWVLDVCLYTAAVGRAGRGASLYVQPGGENVGDFVSGRVMPIIDSSEYLTGIVPAAGSKQPNRIGMIKVGRGFTYWRTTGVVGRGYKNRAGLKSVPVDTLVLDEYDEMPPGTIDIAEHRLDSSRAPWTRIISTPTYPGVGIDPEFLGGTMHRYMLTCEHCGTKQALEWAKNVEQDEDGHHIRVCVECRESIEELVRRAWEPIDRPEDELGEWVAEHPDAPYHSYHISQLYRDTADLDEIAEKLAASDVSKLQEAWNQHLGLPYSPPGGQLSLEELQRAAVAPFTFDEVAGVQGCYLGIDVGAKLHCWMEFATDRWGERGVMQRYLVGAFELDDFAEVDELMARYRVEMCVVDALPETREAQAFKHRHPGRVLLCDYVRGQMPPRIIDATDTDPKRRFRIQVDRTGAMDAIAASIREGRVLFPESAPSVPGLFAHLQAPVRRLEKSATTGETRAVYDEGSRPDHYYHAGTYAELAIYAHSLLGTTTTTEYDPGVRIGPRV